jgi:hypothetical protein
LHDPNRTLSVGLIQGGDIGKLSGPRLVRRTRYRLTAKVVVSNLNVYVGGVILVELCIDLRAYIGVPNVRLLWHGEEEISSMVTRDLKYSCMRYAVLITGPAGAGKSTFSNAFLTHLHASKRTCHLVNLDPAASDESFEYQPSIDIRDLVSLQDVMDELAYGPNGGLMYCFE